MNYACLDNIRAMNGVICDGAVEKLFTFRRIMREKEREKILDLLNFAIAENCKRQMKKNVN